MWKKLFMTIALAGMLLTLFTPMAVAEDEFIFGVLLVGPYNDHGWSQAHYDAGKYVEEKLGNAKMIYIDKVNPADRPGITIPQLVDDMVSKGAKLIIANSDDMKDGARESAMMHPDIDFIHISGDDVLTGQAPKNMANIMGRMVYGKMMAGFAAAMTTQTGKIGYLGPLVNDETRRLAVSAYLGARYAWEKVLGKDPADLSFKVTWIGFWFNIPGVTADPTQVAQNFYNSDYDIVISGIDTTEAVTVAHQKRQEGKTVWAIPYDYAGSCDPESSECLGVPYFNWGPAYLEFIKASMNDSFKSVWVWNNPDWSDINNPETSAVGFVKGKALGDEASQALDRFIADLGSGKVNLFTGPLLYQDGSAFLAAGETATDKKIWYTKQLLKGMEGVSSSKYAPGLIGFEK